jgi:hypothetical protein
MAQFSTGLGLAVLGGCILGAAAISAQRLGGEAFAQGTGGERRIVAASVVCNSNSGFSSSLVAYRIWSDNAVDLRLVGVIQTLGCSSGNFSALRTPQDAWASAANCGASWPWITVDNGTSGFRPLTDVDMSGETDAGDISQVLLDFNTSSDDLPPPPIDCTINAPR